MHEGVIIFIISCLFIVTLLISLMLFIRNYNQKKSNNEL